MENQLEQPFGEACCEHEKESLQQDYRAYYFNEAPFNEAALRPENYLIIGRRGTGKTSLCEYFKFQQKVKNARCIDVDEPEVFFRMMSEFYTYTGVDHEFSRLRLVKVWEYLIWSLIFETYRDQSELVAAALQFSEKRSGPAKMIHMILKGLTNKFLNDQKGELAAEMEHFISSEVIARAQEEMLTILKHEPVIVAIDTLERYSTENKALIHSLSALIQTANQFNIKYAHKGIHIKAFVASEVYPFLAVSAIGNTAKFIRNPVFLQWRPKDMVKLTSWRFYLYLKQSNQLLKASNNGINWAHFPIVQEKMWEPYFGAEITNRIGFKEKSFPYVLRHTQMRPRQLIIILNKIAAMAANKKCFPHFSPDLIVEAIYEVEIELANEVINSYAQIYPGLEYILDALWGAPMIFKGNLLDKYARITASAWPKGDYSPYKFKSILAEMGIIGLLRHRDKNTGIIKADFGYQLRDRLVIHSEEEYVIHPLFNRKFNIGNPEKKMVYPFPDHPDYQYV